MRRVPRLGQLPHSPVPKPETSTHYIMAANHETGATVHVWTRQEVFVVLDRRTGGPLSIATVTGGGAGSLAYHFLAPRQGGSSGTSSWRVQVTGSPCKTVRNVVGQETDV